MNMLGTMRAARRRAVCGSVFKAIALIGAMLATPVVHSQPPSPIVIGQTTALSGGASASAREMTVGASIYFDAVNLKGGVKGRPLKLITLDDGYDPTRAAANAATLIEEHKACALFLTRGTAQTMALLPLLAQHQVPLIAPSTGAMSLRKPVNPYVYNLRSSYQSEAHRAVEQIVGMGITRIGLIYVDDPFGVDAVAGVMDGLEKTGARAAYIEKFDRKAASDTLDRIANVALQANAPAVIVIATNEPTIALIRSLRQRGNRGYVVTLSNNASGSFIEQLGPAGAGVIVAQVFPGERRTDIGLVKEATELLRGSKTHREMKVSPSLLEGVAAAKLLVAALQMTPGASPKQLTDVLQSGVAFDVGWPGYRVAYTPTDHSGIDFVDLSIVSSTGGFRR